MNNPCHKCENRKIGCHADCEAYMEYKQTRAARKKKIDKEKSAERDIRAFEVESRERRRKKGR